MFLCRSGAPAVFCTAVFCRNFDGALEQYTIALTLNPGNALLYSAIGFTHQLKGDLQQAMEYYHKALAKRPEHTFTAELLQNALEEMGNQPLVLAPFQPQEGMDTS
jgi:tetratricopeptide (TPR) repeat protein